MRGNNIYRLSIETTETNKVGEGMASGHGSRKRGENNDIATQTNIDLAWQSRLGILRGRHSLLVLLLLVLQVSGHGHNETQMISCNDSNPKSLYDKLPGALWDSSIRPMTNSTPLKVRLGMIIMSIMGVDEKKQTLTLFIWRTLEWTVPFIKWNESQCGISRIVYPKEKLWIPNVIISEFMDEDTSPNEPYLYINSTGSVYLNEPKRAVISCNLDIYSFPFDHQICTLTFTSYLLEDTDIFLYSKSDNFIWTTSQDLIQNDNNWVLVDVQQNTSSFNVTKRRFGTIQYFVTIKRNPGLFVANLLMPSLFLFSLDVFSFFLPPENTDRAAFKMTLILGYTIFLLIMNDLLPPASENTPLINVFFCLCLALMVASLLESVFIIGLIHGFNTHPKVPKWLNILVLCYLARLVQITPKPTRSLTVNLNPMEKGSSATSVSRPDVTGEAEEVKEDLSVQELRKITVNLQAIRLKVEEHLGAKEYDENWIQVAKVIDRFFFLLYLIFILVSFTIIIILWATH